MKRRDCEQQEALLSDNLGLLSVTEIRLSFPLLKIKTTSVVVTEDIMFIKYKVCKLQAENLNIMNDGPAFHINITNSNVFSPFSVQPGEV